MDEFDNSSDSTDVKHIKNDKWNYSIDIPGYWNSVLPETRLDNPYEVSRFSQNNYKGESIFTISRIPNNPENTGKDIFVIAKKICILYGFKNFHESKIQIGTGSLSILDCEKNEGNDIWKWRFYLIPSGTLLYQLGFGAPEILSMNDEYMKIVNSFKILKEK